MSNNKYKGSLRLDWINKDLSLYYEIDEKEGKGVRPVWVPKNDIRVAEPRIIRFEKSYGEPTSENMVIRGDNLLVLRTLVEMFKDKPEKERVKCIYIDPPYNTGNAFDKYDDNLQHSEWLTMMRDRLILLKKLLRKDGAIIVQIDNQEFAHLKVLLDEIFGRSNYVDFVTLETRTPSGYKVVNPGFFNASEYLLVYAKEKKALTHKTIYKEKEFEQHYNKYVDKKHKKPEHWSVLNLKDVVANKLGFKKWKEGEKEIGKDALMDELRNFALENADCVAALEFVGRKASQKIADAKKKSLDQRGKVYVINNGDNKNGYLYNGREIVFYSKKLEI
jgi:adenine-specific DNA-methyltransferase